MLPVSLKRFYNKFSDSPRRKIILTSLIIASLLILALVLFFLFRRPPAQPPRFLSNIDGSRGKAGPLSGPLGVAFFQSRIYAADSGNGRIQIFEANGKFVDLFSTLPKTTKEEQSPASYPVSIAFDGRGNVYVADQYSPKLLVFSQGKFRYKFPPEKTAKGKRSKPSPLKSPLAVAVANDLIYVIDVADSMVKVFDPGGKLVLEFGGQGTKPGQFNYANGIAVDKDGRIYVADTINARVQIFNSKGEFVFAIDGRPEVKFVLPGGVAIDPWQRVHVVDTFPSRVNVFTKSGDFLFSYGKMGTSNGELYYPNAIAIDEKTRKIAIADRVNNRISVWGY